MILYKRLEKLFRFPFNSIKGAKMAVEQLGSQSNDFQDKSTNEDEVSFVAPHFHRYIIQHLS